MTEDVNHRGNQSNHTFSIAKNLINADAAVMDPSGLALTEDRNYVADFGELSPGTGEEYAATFENPTSDTSAVLYAIITDFSSGTRAPILQNPTTNTPTTSRDTHSLNFGSGVATSGMVVKADTQSDSMAAGDGEDTGIDLTVPSGFEILPYRAVIQPGTTLGVGGGGGLVGETVQMSILYYEQAV